MNQKRLLAVITVKMNHPYYRIWDKFHERFNERQKDTKSQAKCGQHSGNNGLWFEIDDDSMLVVILQNESLDIVLKDFFNQAKRLEDYYIYIAWHRKLEESEANFLGSYRVVEQVKLGHEPGDPVYDALMLLDDNKNVVGGLVVGLNRSDFDKVLEAFKKKLISVLSNIKHRLAHLLAPIDIDLQGFLEKGFNEEYWNEVVQAYKDQTVDKFSEQVKQLVYGMGDEQDTIEKIVNNAIEQRPYRKKEINEAWRNIMKLLPQKEPPNGIKEILNAVISDKRGDLIKKCTGKKNPFHEWLVELDNALNKLISNTEKNINHQ